MRVDGCPTGHGPSGRDRFGDRASIVGQNGTLGVTWVRRVGDLLRSRQRGEVDIIAKPPSQQLSSVFRIKSCALSMVFRRCRENSMVK